MSEGRQEEKPLHRRDYGCDASKIIEGRCVVIVVLVLMIASRHGMGVWQRM
jgi:hypothetical protein